jgi:hypothetical protein
MSLFDTLKSSWDVLVGNNKGRALAQLQSLNPFVQNDTMIESIVDNKLSDAEWRITLAIERKLRDRGISDMQTRVANRMQDQVDAAVSAWLDGTPGLDLDQYNVGLNPKVLARITERLAYFELGLVQRIMSRFVPQKNYMERLIGSNAQNIDSMIATAINKKLNSRNASLAVREAIEAQVDALIEPVVDRIVAQIDALPEIRTPL